MADLGTLKAFITADNSGLITATRQSTTAIQRMSTNIGASLATTGRAIQGFGRSLTIGLTLPIAVAGASMISLASDAEEAASKFGTVFRDVRQEANAAAQEMVTSFGLSNLQAQELLGTTGDLLTGFGFTGEAALDLSTQVNQLAVDLASFTNVEGGVERASQALTSALLGEREAVKSLGIAILDADVQAKVAENTANGLTFATRRQAMAYATLQIALDQSKNAQGDFARTQESVTNQARILRARLSDLAVHLGSLLLPLVNIIIGRILELVAKFQALDVQTQANIIVLAGLAAAAGPVLIIMGSLISLVGAVFTGFGMLLGVISFILSPIGLLVVALAGVIALLIRMKDTTEFVGQAWIALNTVFRLVLSGIGIVLSEITFALARFIDGIILVGNAVGVSMPQSFSTAVQALDEFQQRMAGFSEDQAMKAAEVSGNWGNAWESFQLDVQNALNFVESFVFEKSSTISEMLAALSENLQIGLPGGEEEPEFGPGSPAEQEILDTSTDAWQDWLNEQRDVAAAWRRTWANTMVNVAESFATGFADIIVNGAEFKTVIVGIMRSVASDLIAQVIRSAIVRLAIDQTVTAGNSAAAAPHPFLIPLFVGIGLAAFASAIAGTDGASEVGGSSTSGGGGGGSTAAAAAPVPAAQTQALATSTVTGAAAEEGEGAVAGNTTQTTVVQIDGREVARAVVSATVDGAGDGVNTLALAGGEA